MRTKTNLTHFLELSLIKRKKLFLEGQINKLHNQDGIIKINIYL